MEKNKMLFLLVSFSLISLIICVNYTTPLGHHPNIECGKKNPKKNTDCTKYGTDSGFCCCFVLDSFTQKKNCTLLSIKVAEGINEEGIKGIYDGSYWECGNVSSYINIKTFIITLFIFLICF